MHLLFKINQPAHGNVVSSLGHHSPCEVSETWKKTLLTVFALKVAKIPDAINAYQGRTRVVVSTFEAKSKTTKYNGTTRNFIAVPFVPPD
jgi:hypothetical protein